MNKHINPSVCVIGAGPSGITAIKHLIQVGISDITCYDKNNQVGGNWIFDPDPSHSSVYESSHIISSKALSQYHDFRMPENYPHYPDHKQMLQYFQDYTSHFGVTNYIQFNTKVDSAMENDDHTWEITLSDGSKRTFDYLIVASGHHWDPRMPEIPGSFSGEYIHSHYFKSSSKYQGKRVLVVGGGNSGCDIVVDVSRVAEFTGLSWRRGYYIVPKFVFGQPPDVFAKRVTFLPRSIRKRLFKLTWKLTVGSNEKYGLPKPDHFIMEAHPILNTNILNQLTHGKIHPRKNIKEFKDNIVVFEDDLEEEYDAIIVATGYKISFPFLEYEEFNFENKIVDLYLKMFHPKFPTLAILGLVQPQGCIWPLSDTQAQIMANYIIGKYKWPKNIKKHIEKEVKAVKKNFISSPRHSTEVEYHSFQKILFKNVPKSAAQWK